MTEDQTTPDMDVKGTEDTSTSNQDKTVPLQALHEERQKRQEAQKRLEKLEADLKTREQKELEEREEWKTLAEKRAAELESLQNEIKTSQVKSEAIRQASKLGFNDPEDAVRFIDTSIDDINEALVELANNKPYLLRDNKKPDLGANNNSDSSNQAKVRGWSEWAKEMKDPAKYNSKEWQEEFTLAKQRGLIDYKK